MSSYPLCLFPFREHPVFFMFVQLAIISIFKSYPTVGDVALYMAFLPVWSHLYRCKFLVFDCFFSGMRKCLPNNLSPLSQTTPVVLQALVDSLGYPEKSLISSDTIQSVTYVQD